MSAARRKPAPRRTAVRGAVRAAPPALAEHCRLRDEPDRRIAVLSNGLTLILARHAAEGLVALRAYVGAGSALEAEWAGSGLSHLLEHMLAGGRTLTLGEEACMRRADAIGGLNNAYTTADHTCFHVTADAAHFDVAAEMLADWIVRPLLSETLLRREIGVILRELERDADDVDLQLEDLHRETIFRVHPARFPTIGHPAALRRLRLADVRAYHARMFIPDRTLLVVVGAIDPDDVQERLCRAFAGFERRAAAALVVPDEPPILAPRRAVKPMATASAAAVLSWLTVRPNDADLPALDALLDVLAGGDAGRLVRRLRWDEALTLALHGNHEIAADTPGALEFWLRCEPRHLERAEAVIVEEMQRIAVDGPTDEELDRAREHVRMDRRLSEQTADGLATALGEWFLQTRSADFGTAYYDAIDQLTPADIGRVAHTHAGPAARCLAAILPAETRPAPRRTPAPAERSIVAQRTLPNGLRCLARRAGNDEIVAVTIFFGGGVRHEPPELNGITPLIAELPHLGTESHSARQIAELFERRSARLTWGYDSDWFGQGCVLRRTHLDELLPLFAELVLAPRFDADELARVKATQLDAIARRNEAWQDELQLWADRSFFGDTPYGRPELGDAATVTPIEPGRLRTLHRDWCRGSNAAVAVCGDVDPDDALDRLERCFGGLPAGAGPEAPAPGPPNSTGRDRLFVRTARDRRQVAGVFIGFPGVTIRDPDVPALTVMQTVLAGYELSSGRLFQALRGRRQDLVYEISASLFAGALPGQFALVTGCEPARVPDVYRIIRRELERLRRDACNPAELDRAKTMISTSERDRLQTPFELARHYALATLSGFGPDRLREFLEAVAAVDAAGLRRVARAHLHPATIVVLTPQPRQVRIGLRPESLDGTDTPADS